MYTTCQESFPGNIMYTTCQESFLGNIMYTTCQDEWTELKIMKHLTSVVF